MPRLLPDEQVVTAYRELRERMCALWTTLSDVDAMTRVPFCPAWTVAELASHMVGVNEDILSGSMEGVTTDAWTRKQVDRHRGQTMAELAECWIGLAPTFDGVLPVIPAPVNSQLVMDAVTHEHDLRHALGRAGARDSLAVRVAVGWLLDMMNERGPALVSAFDVVDDFTTMRVLTGRRSVAQMNSVGLDGFAIAKALEGSPLKPPTNDIAE
jgi:uncharacterized protein (TIGR03083 family)